MVNNMKSHTLKLYMQTLHPTKLFDKLNKIEEEKFTKEKCREMYPNAFIFIPRELQRNPYKFPIEFWANSWRVLGEFRWNTEGIPGNFEEILGKFCGNSRRVPGKF